MKNSFAALLVLCAACVNPAAAAVRNYFAPEWQGERLDACMTGSSGCGKPTADAFCRIQGFDNAILFQREPQARTRVLNSPAHCTGAACMSFRQIKCFTAKNDLAGLQQPGE